MLDVRPHNRCVVADGWTL